MRKDGVIIGPIDDWVKYGLYFKDHDEWWYIKAGFTFKVLVA